jgi:hypothetical protein
MSALLSRLELDCTGRGQYRSFSTAYRNLFKLATITGPVPRGYFPASRLYGRMTVDRHAKKITITVS